jgi:hypothetical protein
VVVQPGRSILHFRIENSMNEYDAQLLRACGDGLLKSPITITGLPALL